MTTTPPTLNGTRDGLVAAPKRQFVGPDERHGTSRRRPSAIARQRAVVCPQPQTIPGEPEPLGQPHV